MSVEQLIAIGAISHDSALSCTSCSMHTGVVSDWLPTHLRWETHHRLEAKEGPI